MYQRWGIKGVKFGFVQVGSHRWSVWLHEAVKKEAKYKLIVDVHDEYRPTGFSRTYPNLLTQEGIRGNEEMPDAIHNTTLPFTRYIAGAADYTISYYKQKGLGDFHGKMIQTTSAIQRFSDGIAADPGDMPGVGGSVDVAVITPDQGFVWASKKKLKVGENEIELR